MHHTQASAPFRLIASSDTLGRMATSIHNPTVSTDSATAWVDRYITAWRTNDPGDIAGLFTEDAEYHETPYETDWIGRLEIVDGWQSRWDWQQDGWTFDWQLVSLEGATAVITGIGRYTALGTFDNSWTVRFRTAELCESFTMVNTELSEDA